MRISRRWRPLRQRTARPYQNMCASTSNRLNSPRAIWYCWEVALAALVGLGLSGCAAVSVMDATPREYVARRRGDILSTDNVSDDTRQALNVIAFTPEHCAKQLVHCLEALKQTTGLNEERRLAAQAELDLQRAITLSTATSAGSLSSSALDAYLQSAQLAYAYLFLTPRTVGQRALETRQSQVSEFYNYAVQRSVSYLVASLPDSKSAWRSVNAAGWTIQRPKSDVHFGPEESEPARLLPAAGLSFKGLRNIYQRDGFGATFVAEAATPAADKNNPVVPWRDATYASLSAMLVFPGSKVDDALESREVQILGLDPYRSRAVRIGAAEVPIAANYTAPYGVWLARSRFERQSLRSLFGKMGGLKKPAVILMRPFDPNRLTVVMIHGLASSPDAWIDLGNELMGDEYLRDRYQVWEVYYPTSAPLAINLAQIRGALAATIAHVDPQGSALATHNMILIGHSMGGVLARLLVSSSSDQLWHVIPVRANLDEADRERLHEELKPYVEFAPMPQVSRVIFLAAPHRGTPFARNHIARLARRIIGLPAAVLQENRNLAEALKEALPVGFWEHLPNSIDNLSDTNAFITAAAQLRMAPTVRFHTIVGVHRLGGPLELSTDGVVPYWSSHLPGAESELAVGWWHNVQESPQAIVELRRILQLHADSLPVGARPRPVSGVRSTAGTLGDPLTNGGGIDPTGSATRVCRSVSECDCASARMSMTSQLIGEWP